MKLKLGWGPSAFAVSVTALILSLGGTGYALSSAPSATTAKPAWHNLKLTNGWHNGGFGSYAAGVYKDANRIVHLRGSAAGGHAGVTPSDAVFTLPRSDRPSHTLWLPVYAFDGAAGGLEIQHNGRAFLFDTDSDNNVVGYSSFDGISFPAP
jgi:hypothetical protein